MAFEKSSLSEFIAANSGQLAPMELAISDGITDYLVEKQDLDPVDLAVVVDADQDDPVVKSEGGSIFIRYNGRFSLPKFAKNGAEVALDPAGWRELLKEWFQENGIQYAFDDTAQEVMKFTAIAPSFDVPEGDSSEADEPAEEESEPSEESEDEEPVDEPSDEESDSFEEELNK